MELDILKVWPDWEATRLIGEGSFGKVYEIVRNNFGIEEHCALKVITIPSSPAELESMRNEGIDDVGATEYYRGLVEEFVQEIALLSKLKGNVNVVGYEDYAVIEHKDTIGWDILIRMELLTPLPTYIRTKSFTVNNTIRLAMDMCSALEVCYEQKIIHRDIKPDNIFVSAKGDYKLGDFGVARTMEKTVSGLSKKGTYTYMAPEVYRGDIYGTNVDLYSLGIVMYKLLNHNREPFLPPHPEVIKYNHKNDALARRMRGDLIPPPVNCNRFLGNVILKAVSFQSRDRYSHPAQMKADLQAVLDSLDTGAAPVLHADHLAASRTCKTGQSQNSIQQINTPTQAPNNTAISGAIGSQQSVQAPYQQAVCMEKNKQSKSATLRKVGYILGWIGAPLWMIIFLNVDLVMFLLTLLIAVSMILLTVKALASHRKLLSILMLVLSAVTLNVLNIAAAIVFLLANKTQQQETGINGY